MCILIIAVLQDSKTPLHFAVAVENIGLVTALLQKEGDTLKDPSRVLMVNIQDKFGDTALHVASRLGNKPIAKQLLNFKVDDNLMNQASDLTVDSPSFCTQPTALLTLQYSMEGFNFITGLFDIHRRGKQLWKWPWIPRTARSPRR